MQRTIIIIGLCILSIGAVFTLIDVASQGNMSMSGILDRLRSSYPDRSGKELEQALNALPGVLIVIGAIVTAWGIISHPRSSISTKALAS
ncbi:MAG: hypothetical protein NWE83_13020 [Candidatus Bathyarchaeota archaeon]|nr:hypothetical protein [Candidatus Bathyarchaeota archaeon]